MKILYTTLFLFVVLISFGQKNNYNSFRAHDDDYVDKILNSQRYVSSSSDYLFYENLKSVYISQFDSNHKKYGSSIKTVYDDKKKCNRKNYL